MAVTVVTTFSELDSWITARNAQSSYTEDEYAEIPASTTINITADLTLNPTNAGSYEVCIRPQSGGGITGRLWPIYGTRATLALRDYSSLGVIGKGRIRGIQLTRTQSFAGAYNVGGGARIEQCIIDAGSQSSADLVSNFSGGGTIAACLLVTSSTSGRAANAAGGGTLALERCTVVANGRTGTALRSDFGDLRVTGCAVYDFSGGDLTGSLAGGSTHNATSSGTALGTSGQTSVTSADFVNVSGGSEDFFPVNTSTKLYNTGTTISGVTVDLFGTSLPQGAANDIGAGEVIVAGDTTAPTLSSASASGGSLSCGGSVTTNEGNGTLYTVFTDSATAPTAVQVEAGQNQSGAAALRAVSQAVTTSGAQSVGSGSITAGTRYAHFMHKDAAGNRSTVVSSSSFTVTSGGGSVTTPYFSYLIQPRG